MKLNVLIKFIPMTCLALALAGCSSSTDKQSADASPASDAKLLRVEDEVMRSVSATVKAINQETREVTLTTAAGEPVTFTADRKVQRLNEIHVGDQVRAEYYVSIARELRAPTAEEKESPVMLVAGAARAPKGTDPAAGTLRVIRVVTTVTAIDLPNQFITLEIPGGTPTTVRAPSMENLKKVRVGDTIIVTFTEGLAVSVEKLSPAAK